MTDSPLRAPLRVGILLDSFTIPAWEYVMFERMSTG